MLGKPAPWNPQSVSTRCPPAWMSILCSVSGSSVRGFLGSLSPASQWKHFNWKPGEKRRIQSTQVNRDQDDWFIGNLRLGLRKKQPNLAESSKHAKSFPLQEEANLRQTFLNFLDVFSLRVLANWGQFNEVLKFLPSGGALGVSAAFAASGFDSKLRHETCEEKGESCWSQPESTGWAFPEIRWVLTRAKILTLACAVQRCNGATVQREHIHLHPSSIYIHLHLSDLVWFFSDLVQRDVQVHILNPSTSVRCAGQFWRLESTPFCGLQGPLLLGPSELESGAVQNRQIHLGGHLLLQTFLVPVILCL